MSRVTIACGGDSQTDFTNGLGVTPEQCWPGALSTALRASGYDVRARGFGLSGDTSADLLGRLNSLTRYDTPQIGVIYVGVNDPGNGIVQATTQLNIEAMIMSLKHGATGDGGYAQGLYAAAPASLPSGGILGQRLVVLSDNSSGGGQSAWHSTHAATLTGAGSNALTVWENRYPLAGSAGWGRVATASTAPTVVKRIVVVTANYLNWTSGGDTTATPYATYAAVRAGQAAAVAAQNVTVDGASAVVLANLYTFMRNRLVAGTDVNFRSFAYAQGSSWHVADSNQHHSAYGHTLVAQCIEAALPAAWLAELPTA